MQNNSILFDSSVPFDGDKLAILEQTISNLYSPNFQINQNANQILEQLKQMPEFWLTTDQILDKTQSAETKLFCLMSIKKGVETKWNILPQNQREGIKNFIINYVYSNVNNIANKESRLFLGKANSILVEIIKKEWNNGWDSAISDIIKSSYQSQELCENNFKILKELSQEIFDFSKDSLTSSQVKEFKMRFAKDFESVYQVCDFVLKGYIGNPQSVKLSLLNACLETLHAFLGWMPLVYIFMTDLIEGILMVLLKDKKVYLTILKCLEEIVIMKYHTEDEETQLNIKKKTVILFSEFLNVLMTMHPPTTSFETIRDSNNEKNVNLAKSNQFLIFLKSSQLILSELLQRNTEWFEEMEDVEWFPIETRRDLLITSLKYAIKYTEVNDFQLFKQCCDFWLWYSAHIKKYENDINLTNNSKQQNNNYALKIKKTTQEQIRENVHRKSFIMNEALMIIMLKVPKPEEVLITVDENGIPKKVTQQYAQSTQLYNIIKETLKNFALFDWEIMNNIFLGNLEKLKNNPILNFDKMNSLSWAVGTLENTLEKNLEKGFLIKFLRSLLQMCENKKDIESKSILASCIMHIVSQFNKFLKTNIQFLKTVMNKLIEFMKNEFPGVKEMACNIFLKISKKAKNSLGNKSIKQTPQGDIVTNSYLQDFILNIKYNTENLLTLQKIQIYEAIGHMIEGVNDNQEKINFLYELMKDLEISWQGLIANLHQLRTFVNENILSDIGFYLQINERLAESIGIPYSVYFDQSFNQIDTLYNCFYEMIQLEIQEKGPVAINYIQVKKYRAVRRSLLNLLETFVKSYKENPKLFIKNYGQIMSFVMNKYSIEIQELREPEVLLFMAECVKNLKVEIEDILTNLMSSVLDAVLPMITQDFSSYPEHRANFFVFLQAIVKNCFEIFFSVEEEQFKTIINCVIWAMKHDLPALYEIGLETMSCILECLDNKPEFASKFYQFYFVTILSDTLFVLTDGFHTNGFSLQSEILFLLFCQIPKINQPLIPNGNGNNNLECVMNFMLENMSQNFSNLAISDHQKLIGNILNNIGNVDGFKTSLRDYLVSLELFTLQEE